MAGQNVDDELLSFIANVLEIPITKEQLNNPTQEIITPILQLFLTEFGLHRIHELDLRACVGISRPQNMKDILLKIQTAKAVNLILANMGFTGEFTLSDMLQPKKKKTMRILGHLSELWVTLNENNEKYDKVAQQNETMAQKKEQLRKACESLKQELATKSQLVAKNRAMKETHIDQYAQKEEDLFVVQSEGNEYNEKYTAAKRVVAEKKEFLSGLQAELNRLTEDLEMVELKIVNSPQKIKSETSRLETLRTAKMNEKRKLQSEYVAAMTEADTYSKMVKNIKPAMGAINNVFTGLEDVKVLSASVDELKETTRAKEREKEQIKVIVEQNQQLVAQQEENVKKQASRHNIRMKPVKNLIEQVEKQLENSATLPLKTLELIKEERETRDALSNLQKKKDKLESAFTENVEKFNKVVNSYKSAGITKATK